MTEPIPQEHWQPSLLDRLTDDQPDRRQESQERRGLSAQDWREKICRDLEWLLDTVSLPLREGVERYPYVAGSVLNYGLPALAGRTAQSLAPGEVEGMLGQAIRRFEPRILPATLQVRALAKEPMRHNTLIFEIEGELRGGPVAEPLRLRIVVDLESGRVGIEAPTGAEVR